MDKGFLPVDNMDLYIQDRTKINNELETKDLDTKFDAAFQEMFGTTSEGAPIDGLPETPADTLQDAKDTVQEPPSQGIIGGMLGTSSFETPGNEPTEDGLFGGLFDIGKASAGRVLDILGAPQDALFAGAARPEGDPGIFGKDFDGGPILNAVGHGLKDIKVGGQAFINSFLGTKDPLLMDKAANNLGVPEKYKTAFNVLADPTIFIGLPATKLIQSSLRKAVEEGVDVSQGLFAATVSEFLGVSHNASLSIDSIRKARETKEFEALARAADSGDKKAAKKLIDKIDKSELATSKAVELNDFDIAEEATRIKGILGDPAGKDFEIQKFSKEDSIALTTKSMLDSSTYKKVGINYSKLNGDAQTMVTMENLVEIFSADFTTTLKTVPNEDTVKAAQNSLLSDLIGKPINVVTPERAYGIRMFMLASARSVNELATKAGTTGAELDLLAVEKAVAFHRIIQAEALGLASNLGRSLQALSIPVVEDSQLLKIVGDFAKNSKDNPRRDINSLIATINSNPFADMSKLSRFLSKQTLARVDDALFENYANSILSGAAQLVNLGNNAAITLWQVPQQSVKAMTASARALVNAPVAALSGNENKAANEAFQEIAKIGATASGIFQGVSDVMKLAYKSNTRVKALRKSGIEQPKKLAKNATSAEKKEFARQTAIFEKAQKRLRAKQWGDLDIHTEMRQSHELQAQRYQPSITSKELGASGPLGSLIDYAGRAIRVPGNALLQADKGFKLINYRASINQQAVEAAYKVAPDASSAAKKTAYLNYKSNPPSSDMVDNALDVADYLTFTNKLEGGFKDAQNLLARPGLRYILPFFRTPTNIVKMGLRHSTLGHVFQGDFKQALTLNNAKGDAARARIATGTIAPLSIVMNIDEDRITGHIDRNTTEGKLLLAKGIKPYNIVIKDPITGKDRIFDYSKIEPLRTVLGMAVNYKKAFQNIEHFDIKGEPTEQSKELFIAFVAPFIHAVGDNYLLPQLGAVTEAMDAVMSSNSTQLERLLNNFASSNVPFSALQRDVNKAFLDNNFRQADSFITNMMRGIPVLSSELPKTLTPWGDEVLHDPVVHEDIRNPLHTKLLSLDKYDELIADSETPIPRKRTKISVPGTGLPGGISIPLTPEQTYRHGLIMGKGLDPVTGERVFGSTLKETFIEMIDGDDPSGLSKDSFIKLPKLVQQQEFKKRFTEAQELTDAYLLANDEDLKTKIKDTIENRVSVLNTGK